MKKLFFGGPIITMDESNPTVEAVLVEEGIIASTGSLDELLAGDAKDAERVDLGGNVMLPGLIEPHAHLDLSSFMYQGHFIGGLRYDSAEEVIEQIKIAVANTPEGKWVFCFGLDYLINRDLPEIDRHWLDKISTKHPIMILVQSMHTLFANSLALETMDITSETPEPRDGHIYKDAQGNPNGVLTEQTLTLPFMLAWLKDLGKSPEQLTRELFSAFKKKGITATWTAGITALYPNQVELLSTWGQTAPVRQDYAITFNAIERGAQAIEDLPKDTPMSKFTGVKFWYDGSPYTGNMFMEENYLDNETMQKRLHIPPNQAGERLFPQDTFYELLKKYHNQGFQISVHSQGDRSNRELIDMLERVITEYPRADHRHRIEHCAFMHPEDVKRCADLGITLSYHVGHLYYYGEALNELVIGTERMNKEFMLCKTALEEGVTISLHSDDPMYFADPMLLVATAASRTSKKGNPITQNQAIDVHQAMRAITVDAAWQMGRENELGSIECGKFADFTVLGANPYEVDSYAIKDIDIITTYLAGVDTDTL